MPRTPKAYKLDEFEIPQKRTLGHRVSIEADEMLKTLAKQKGWDLAWTLEVAIRTLYRHVSS